MSLFDLQDVCIAIGSIATLDLPMVVDLIGIYGLKGPYCTLTMTDWFLQTLSVIPRGSWGDVARRFTMIRWADHCIQFRKLSRSVRSDRSYGEVSPPPSSPHTPPPPPPRFAGIRSGRFDEENPFVQNSSVLLVRPDEGVSVQVVDRIGDYLPQSTEKSRVLVIPVGARHKCQQDFRSENENRETTTGPPPRVAALEAARLRAHVAQHLAHRLRMVAGHGQQPCTPCCTLAETCARLRDRQAPISRASLREDRAWWPLRFAKEAGRCCSTPLLLVAQDVALRPRGRRPAAHAIGARCRWSAAPCRGRVRPCGARDFRWRRRPVAAPAMS
ncbi:hypothetical protein F511_08815 [Dorcoceras hygrometricum]|uniref:Acyl-CoA dehydrogenase-related protein n=1 Tax=Dorcoceras hygrometricum TaxID=472368 RepID=A0A2Z7BZ76_9LAMI|nr:hypothetical protein F511_08815 [Dorcoceras hygrometricum]